MSNVTLNRSIFGVLTFNVSPELSQQQYSNEESPAAILVVQAAITTYARKSRARSVRCTSVGSTLSVKLPSKSG